MSKIPLLSYKNDLKINFNSVYLLQSYVKFIDSPFSRHVGLVLYRTTLASDWVKKV